MPDLRDVHRLRLSLTPLAAVPGARPPAWRPGALLSPPLPATPMRRVPLLLLLLLSACAPTPIPAVPETAEGVVVVSNLPARTLYARAVAAFNEASWGVLPIEGPAYGFAATVRPAGTEGTVAVRVEETTTGAQLTALLTSVSEEERYSVVERMARVLRPLEGTISYR